MADKKESRREFFQKTAAASVGLSLAPSLLGCTKSGGKSLAKSPPPATPEWRNKQDGMSYRMLGRTGMMVSELVMGTFPFVNPDFYPALDAGIERGMNYIDCAAAYSNGQVESNIGNYIKERGNRDNVFLSTKLSFYYGYIDRALKELEKDLPESKKDALMKKAEDMMASRAVMKPGYHMNFFQGQEGQFPKTYYRHLLLTEYGYKAGWKKKMKEHAYRIMEDSLKRLQTDHVDVLHCPHGIAMPEMMEDDVIREIFTEFKQKGMIRAAAVSFHNDVSAHLAKAIEVGYYDVAMFAYNIANHAALENLMSKGKEAGLGMIAMKVAKLLAMKDQPEWRAEKLNTTIPDEELSVFSKAYLWALQNPNLSCCVSEMNTVEIVADNYKIIGKKVDVKPV